MSIKVRVFDIPVVMGDRDKRIFFPYTGMN